MNIMYLYTYKKCLYSFEEIHLWFSESGKVAVVGFHVVTVTCDHLTNARNQETTFIFSS